MTKDIDLGLPAETARLRVRHLAAGDFAAMCAIESPPEVARWLYWEPRTEAEVRQALDRRIVRARDHSETGVTLGAEIAATGELIGHVSLTVEPHRQGEIGFIFNPDHQGRGYATEAAAAVLGIAFGAY